MSTSMGAAAEVSMLLWEEGTFLIGKLVGSSVVAKKGEADPKAASTTEHASLASARPWHTSSLTRSPSLASWSSWLPIDIEDEVDWHSPWATLRVDPEESEVELEEEEVESESLSLRLPRSSWDQVGVVGADLDGDPVMAA
jgi:hypothetical protein